MREECTAHKSAAVRNPRLETPTPLKPAATAIPPAPPESAAPADDTDEAVPEAPGGLA
jgi:hypothetical protein